jgi:hypothetical protein
VNPFLFTAHPAPSPGSRHAIVPAAVATKKDLLDFLARAIPLPAYFGHNWDALEECLLDLNDRLELIHTDLPLAAAPRDQGIYLELLAAAATGSPRLRVIFPEAVRAEIHRIFADEKRPR